MPVKRIRFDANNPARQELVPPGSVLNGITLLDVPAGVTPFIQLGNNEEVGPFLNPQPIDFGSDVDPADVSEGVWMRTTTLVPGAVVTGFVSYRSSNAGAAASVGIPPILMAAPPLPGKPVY